MKNLRVINFVCGPFVQRTIGVTFVEMDFISLAMAAIFKRWQLNAKFRTVSPPKVKVLP